MTDGRRDYSSDQLAILSGNAVVELAAVLSATGRRVHQFASKDDLVASPVRRASLQTMDHAPS